MPIHNHGPIAGGYRVQFRDGGAIYDYQGVEREDVQAIQQAEPDDVGAVIRSLLVNGAYPFEKVDPNQPETEGGDAA